MIVVIGYGNTLCGDDGIGPYVAETLSGEIKDSNVEFYAVRQLAPELSEAISHADAVIFIDAWVGKTPGLIDCHELMPLPMPEKSVPGAFTHHVHAVGLLDTALILYNRRPRAYIYGMVGQTFTFGAGFSPAVETALPSLLAAVKERITLCTNMVSLKQF